MNSIAMDYASQALYLVLVISLPPIVIASVIGIVLSLVQAVTQLQEQTLTFVPKIICVFLGMMIFGSWILTNLTEFINTLWSDFSIYLG